MQHILGTALLVGLLDTLASACMHLTKLIGRQAIACTGTQLSTLWPSTLGKISNHRDYKK